MEIKWENIGVDIHMTDQVNSPHVLTGMHHSDGLWAPIASAYKGGMEPKFTIG
jgi:hypothetical protein